MISVKELTKKFPDGTVALKKTSFSIEGGEAVAVIGPSGAGKTTLFRALTRSLNLDNGSISINGSDIYALPYAKLKKVRRSIGVIYQQHNLVKELPVAINVAAGLLGSLSTLAVLRLLFLGPDQPLLKRVSTCLDEVGLNNKLFVQAGNLSGGEQQRVAVARLLIQDPSIILADEPIASVDPISAERVMDSLVNISKSRGKTLVCNIHNIDVAHRYFNRVLALRNGEIVFDGPPAKLDGDLLQFIYEGEMHENGSFRTTGEVQTDLNSGCGCFGTTAEVHVPCGQKGSCR